MNRRKSTKKSLVVSIIIASLLISSSFTFAGINEWTRVVPKAIRFLKFGYLWSKIPKSDRIFNILDFFINVLPLILNLKYPNKKESDSDRIVFVKGINLSPHKKKLLNNFYELEKNGYLVKELNENGDIRINQIGIIPYEKYQMKESDIKYIETFLNDLKYSYLSYIAKRRSASPAKSAGENARKLSCIDK
jgi:hypothetical protein